MNTKSIYPVLTVELKKEEKGEEEISNIIFGIPDTSFDHVLMLLATILAYEYLIYLLLVLNFV